METILFIVLIVGVLNTILLMAIARSLLKLINSLFSEEPSVPRIVNASSDLPLVGPPTYDLDVLNGKAEPFTDGLITRLSPTKNWDGISP